MNDVSVIRVSRCGIIRGTLSGKHVLTLIWMIMTGDSFKIVSNWAVLTYSGEWTLMRRVRKKDLLFEPWKHVLKPTYYKAGFHPNGDLIFFYDRSRETLISYDMSCGDWRVVCTLEHFKHAHRAFFAYVPWYSRGLASPSSN